MLGYTTRRGSYTKAACYTWLSELLNSLTEDQRQNCVVVCDNAPCHSDLEAIFRSPLYSRGSLLRLAPYSPALNPIEGVWSVVKQFIKTRMQRDYKKSIGGDPEKLISQREWRLRCLEQVATEARSKVTPNCCSNMVKHVRILYPDVLCNKNI